MTETKKVIRIRRAPRDTDNPYFLHRRDTAQDRRLSYEARGMLGDLLSRPDDWIVTPKALETPDCKRDKVYRILNELITVGYVHRQWLTEKGIIRGVEYLVYEIPFTEKPDTASPDTAKPDNTYKRNIQKEESNTLGETSSPAGTPVPPIKLSTRFTASRWYAFNPNTLRFGVRNYTKKEADTKAPELVNYGFIMVKGSDLNARPDAESLIGVANNSAPLESVFSVFAKYAFGIKLGQSIPQATGKRIGDMVNQFAELLMKTRNEVDSDKDLIRRVEECYLAYKTCRPNMTVPQHTASFIPWWNEWVEKYEGKVNQTPAAPISATAGLNFN